LAPVGNRHDYSVPRAGAATLRIPWARGSIGLRGDFTTLRIGDADMTTAIMCSGALDATLGRFVHPPACICRRTSTGRSRCVSRAAC